jgi:hypothetical protein
MPPLNAGCFDRFVIANRGYTSEEIHMAEIRRDEIAGNPGLSTAALAHADEQTYQDQRSEDRAVEERDRFNSAETRMDTEEASTSKPEEQTALFSQNESKSLRSQWDSIQVGFVDEPRQAVERADALVAGAMKRLAEMFAEERSRLEGQWDRGDSVSTEELRQALRRYRSFFGRLLSV